MGASDHLQQSELGSDETRLPFPLGVLAAVIAVELIWVVFLGIFTARVLL